MQIVIGLLIGSILAPGLLAIGFYSGYKFAKSKLPEITPTINISVEKPKSPVLGEQQFKNEQRETMAEFINGL